MDGFLEDLEMIETYQNLLSLHTSVDVCTPTLLYETNEIADRPAHRTVLSIKTLNILSG